MFEEICCDLFFDEQRVQNPERYGRPRQTQFGVDLVADRRDGTGVDALSCKCYKSIKPRELRKFADEFLDHWSTHWAPQAVRRFILCVACDLRGHERRAEIQAEKARFKALGVQFEVWAQRELSIRLRRSPELARQFFEPFPSSEPSTPPLQLAASGSTGLISTAVISQIGALQSVVEQAVAATLDEARELLLRGHQAKARKSLLSIRGDQVRWSSLGPAIQARLLRQQAIIALNSRHRGECRALLDEADTLAPDAEPRVRALLGLREAGPTAALNVLASVKSKEGALLRAGLLIEADRLSDAEALLQEWNSMKGVDAEWHRLTAFIACLQHRSDDALEHILTAERLAPDWIHILESGGIVRYARALSTAVPFRLVAVPEPVPSEFARADDESQAHLQDALDRFSMLCERSADPECHQRWRLWKFACGALMPQGQAQAEADCLQLIAQTPTSAVAIFWALTNGYALALPATLRRLEQQLRGDGPSIDDLQAAVACAVEKRDYRKAAAILGRHGARFSDEKTAAIVQLWSTRIAQARTRQRAPISTSDPLDRVDAALQAAQISGDPAIVQDALGTIVDQPHVIFMACRLLAGRQQWAPIAAFADRLVKEVANAEAVRMAAYALYHERHYERVQQLLDQHQQLFPRGSLPPELIRLQAFAATKRGDLPTALPIANALAQRTGDVRDRALLVDLLIHTGDVARAVPHLRDLLPTRNWTAQELLRWVPGISTEERGLARTLLQMAMARDDSLTESAAVLDWSFRLGLDREASEFLGRVQANESAAQHLQLKSASLDEIAEFIRHQQQVNAEMGRRYRRGEAPIHVLITAIRANLAVVWASAFANDGSVPDLFIRSGNRATEFFSESTPPDLRTLYIDVTAVLTIDQLDLWETLGRSGISLVFPHSLQPLLQYLEHRAYPRQSSRMEVMSRILAQVDQQAIRGWLASVPLPERTAFVRFELSPTDPAPQITIGGLLEELVRRGGITARRASEVREIASDFTNSETTTDPAQIERLVFEGNTIDVAVETDLLEALQARFAVFIEEEHRSQCRAEVQQMRTGIQVAERLARLRRRLAEGITQGTYKLLPEPSHDSAQRHGAVFNDPHGAALLELFQLPYTPASWIWIDDRYCTSYTYINSNSMVSTFEVLRYLAKAQWLDEANYYRLLDRMRASRVQVLPVCAEEIFLHLQHAPFGADGVTETLQLQHLRLNFNRLLELESDLRLEDPSVPGKPLSERPCLLEAFRLARASLELVWKAQDVARDWQIAASNWIWESLRVEHFTRLPADTSPEGRAKLHQMSLLLYLAVGLSLPTKARNEDEDSPRKAYLQWLMWCSTDLSASVDSATLKQAATQLSGYLIKDILNIDSADHPPEVSAKFLRAFVLSFMQDLPEPLRDALLSVPEFVAETKPTLRDLVKVETVEFEAVHFWDTLARAWQGTDGRLQSIAGDDYDVHASGEVIEILGAARSFQLAPPEFALLALREEHRRAFLTQEPWLADGAEAQANALMDEIAQPPTPAARLRAYENVRDRLVSGRYSRLERLLAQNPTPSFSAEMLRPASSQNYLTYLSLVMTAEGNIDWDISARTLLTRTSAEDAMVRWQALPIRLPPPLRATWDQLDAQCQRRILERLTGRGSTPMSLLRAMELIAASAVEQSDGEALSMLANALEGWETQTQTFTTLLSWAERAAERDPSWRSCTIAQRLAVLWSHADRVLSTFRAHGSPPELLIERFARFHPRSVETALPFETAYEGDIAAPRRMNGSSLLVAGLTVAFGARAPTGVETIREALLNVLTQVHPSGRFPIRELFEDRRNGANHLGSFFDEGTPEWLALLCATDAVPALTGATGDQARLEVASGLKANSAAVSSWVLLQMIGFEWLPAEERRRLSECIRTLAFPEYSVDADSMAVWIGLLNLLPYLDEKTQADLQASLLAWMTRLRSIHPQPVVQVHGEGQAAHDASLALELGMSLCRQGSLKDSVLRLSALLPAMADSWPALAQDLRRWVETCFAEIPARDADPLWPAYISLRARP